MDVAQVIRHARGIAVIALAALGACGGDAGSSGAEGGGTVIVGVRSDFGGFNPITNSDLYTGELINFALFTPLVQYDADLNVVPHLAQSWQEQGDTAVVFELRRDVRWHDGRPVTAHDVVFTFERAKDPATTSPLLGPVFLQHVAAAQAIDSFTVRFRYARPHAQALEDFWWAPVPMHLLDSIPAAELRNAAFSRQPVGSGPFRLVEWRAAERLVLERNPDFPESLGGPPELQRVVLRIIPEASTLLTELVTGGVHVDIPVVPDQVDQIRADAALQMFAYPGRTLYYVGWNHARAPFDDARVRRALALAIDRREIIDALLHGQGELASSPIPPWSPVHPDGVTPLTRSLEEAAALLERAGWRDSNGDGIRENAQGQALAFDMLSSDDALRRAVVEVLQSQLRQVGADVRIRIVEFQTMIADHRSRNFDAIFTNWILDNFQVAATPRALLHSAEADRAGSPNRSSVRDAQLDRLIEQGEAATDPAEQRRIWNEFTGRLQELQPLTFMFWLNELAAANSNVTGVEMDPRGEFLTVARWSVAGR
jgi:peptide/nickel transport system substrate-binding protein